VVIRGVRRGKKTPSRFEKAATKKAQTDAVRFGIVNFLFCFFCTFKNEKKFLLKRT
jgi:hypothetical protein